MEKQHKYPFANKGTWQINDENNLIYRYDNDDTNLIEITIEKENLSSTLLISHVECIPYIDKNEFLKVWEEACKLNNLPLPE
jgi:uncharacterized protein YjiK